MAATAPIPQTALDLDADLGAAKVELAKKKDETKTARGRVRQVSRQRRRQRRREIAEALTSAAPRATGYTLTVAGLTAFSIALTFLAIGNLAAALVLFPVAGAAWALGALLLR